MTITPLAVGPLMPLHRRANAKIETVCGWEAAVSYPSEPDRSANAIVDLTGRNVTEINGPQTDAVLLNVTAEPFPICGLRSVRDYDIYRLTNARVIIFGGQPIENSINLTGGWASIGLYGPQVRELLQKITAIDLRDSSLGIGRCAQGPVFGVNVLFGHFTDHWELHACPDMTQFLWEVLLDAGEEFLFRPVGRNWLR